MRNITGITLVLAALPVVLGASSDQSDQALPAAPGAKGGQVVKRSDLDVVQREHNAWSMGLAQADSTAGSDSTDSATASETMTGASSTQEAAPASDSAAGATTEPAKHGFFYRLFHRKATNAPATDSKTADANAPASGKTDTASQDTAAEPAASSTAGSGEPATTAGSTEELQPASTTPRKHGFFYKMFHHNATEAQPGETDTAAVPAAGESTGAPATGASSSESGQSASMSATTTGDTAATGTAATDTVATDTAGETTQTSPKHGFIYRMFHRKHAGEQTTEPPETAAAGTSTGAPVAPGGESEAASNESPGFWHRLRLLLPGGKKQQVSTEPPEYLEDETGFLSNDQTQHAVSLLGTSLTLNDYLMLVAAKDDKIAYQRLEYRIAKTDSSGARAMFEPALTASYKYTDNDTPNTTEEQFRLSFAPQFIERNHDYEVGVEKKVPSGAKVKVAYSWMHLSNNIQPQPIRGKEDKAYVGVSVTQPLLKGGGGSTVVKSPIEVADKDQQIARQTYRQSMFQTVSDAAMAYWDLYLADKKVAMREKSVQIAQSVLDDEQQRAKFGQGSDTDVMSAKSAVAQRKVQLYQAQQEQVQARNKMRSYLVGIPDQYQIRIDTSGDLASSEPLPPRTKALQEAYHNRPEYLASRLRAEKEDVKIKFARNNRLPQLDLVASYGLNGLDKSYGHSWQDTFSNHHQAAYIGIEYKMYLRGDKKSRAALTQAQLRKRQALLEIRAAEMAIQNSVDTAVNNLQAALKQVHELDSIIATNNKLLDVEMTRFKSGHSNSRDLLQLEQRLNETKETYLESKTNLQKAVIGVDLAEGTLLKDYELED